MQERPLFRTEALRANDIHALGGIVLVRPLSFFFLTSIAAGLTLLIVTFFAAGSYTRRQTVAGRLMPDFGVVTVYAPQPGIVVQKLVSEGKAVRRGDTIYVVSSERHGIANSEVQSAVSDKVALRQQSLRAELIQTRQLQQSEERALQMKIDASLAEQANIAGQIGGQQTRIQIIEDSVKRSGQLIDQGFLSKEVMQQKQADLLDQHNRLQALERDQISIVRELMSQRGEQASLPLRQRNQLAQIERQLNVTDQEWTESEAKRHLAIPAPQSGTVTAIAAETGQTVDGGKALVSILPNGAVLEAHLYAPSRAIGFIKRGDAVLLRYQAFPYQKFGHARGNVMSVSRTAILASELPGMPNVVLGSGEALYRITVKLERQTHTAFGKEEALQPGMLLEADVLQEKRKLYEWALAPLYSLTGKI